MTRRPPASAQPRDFPETVLRKRHSSISGARRHTPEGADGRQPSWATTQAPRPRPVQAPQCHSRPAKRRRQARPAQGAKRRRAGMARRGEGGGNEARLRVEAPCPRQPCPAMHRRRQHGPGRARPPGRQEGQHPARRRPVWQMQPGPVSQRRPSVATDDQHKPPRPTQPRQPGQHRRRRATRQHPRPARQARRRRPRVWQPHRVREQPEARQSLAAPANPRLEPARPPL